MTKKKQPTVAIVCDNWKLPIFRKGLKEAQLQFKTVPFTKEATSIIVNYNRTPRQLALIQSVARECEQKAKASKN